MNHLTVFTRLTDDPFVFEVLYANGVQKQGTLFITVPFSISRKDIAAELGALHHLLVEASIFGDDRAGNNLHLTVSRGQIKKLFAGRSGLPELLPWAGALIVQFTGAHIQVESQSASWEKPRRLQQVLEIVLPDRLDTYFTVAGFGALRLSMHAIDQFCLRSNQPAAHEAWRQLKYMLSPALQIVQRDESVDALARERHGTAATILYAPATHWNFVVAHSSATDVAPTIVTTYFYKRRAEHLHPLILATPGELKHLFG